MPPKELRIPESEKPSLSRRMQKDPPPVQLHDVQLFAERLLGLRRG